MGEQASSCGTEKSAASAASLNGINIEIVLISTASTASPGRLRKGSFEHGLEIIVSFILWPHQRPKHESLGFLGNGCLVGVPGLPQEAVLAC